MSRACEQLDAFADGELDPGQADSFRGHLAHCPDCPDGLRELLALQARVRSLPPQQLILPGRSVQRPRRWWVFVPALALLAVALFWTRFARPPEPLQVAGLTRAVEGRLSHPLLAAHRPYDAARSGTSQLAPLPLGALARLEERGDSHGVADAYLDRGELGQAEAFLRGLPDSADVRSDRAALALARGESAAALRWAEAALAQTAQHPQARWNRALALGQLGLSQLAARELRAQETLDEPGWAQEAKLRADALEEAQAQQRAGWERLRVAGEAMVAGGPVLDEEAAAHHPGLARLYLYDAVRTAADPARLDVLRPLAIALDRRAGGEVLQRLVAQVTPSPALATDYLRLVRRESPAPHPQALLTAATRAGRTDLALGVMLLGGTATAQPQRYLALATASGDPWFQLLAEQTLARAQAAAGDLARAEETLGRLLERCPLRGLEYRCGLAAIQLAQLRVSAHRLDDAVPLIEQGEAFARAAGDWGLGLSLLALRAEAARLGDALSVAAATLQEHQLRSPEGCATQRYQHLSLAAVYFQQGRADAARTQLA
ncbi:MAG: zf-HC2 domain-containing protein, partial [Myxococcota bacterium]|nr:zf-HC2 domain-containing protein [Myxococcota bacterium]